jgi:hypothetical protein
MYINNIIKRLEKYINLNISDKEKNLGRWKITYLQKTINKKVDLANEDNCGVCYSSKYHNIPYLNSKQ